MRETYPLYVVWCHEAGKWSRATQQVSHREALEMCENANRAARGQQADGNVRYEVHMAGVVPR